jgi:hypothetical protein
MEKKQYQLMCTYLKGKFFISTIYREASTIEPMWYFETMAWEWDAETQKRGSIVEMDDSGISEEMAMDNHLLMVKKLNELILSESSQACC